MKMNESKKHKELFGSPKNRFFYSADPNDPDLKSTGIPHTKSGQTLSVESTSKIRVHSTILVLKQALGGKAPLFFHYWETSYCMDSANAFSSLQPSCNQGSVEKKRVHR